MNKTPLVGISLLTYNQGKYLDASLAALKRQTFQDFEIHLIDDGSTDGVTPEIFAKVDYEKISQKFPYKSNLGNAKRRFDAYQRLKNKYILDLSADDVLEPTFLEKTVRFLESHPKYGAVSVNLRLFNETPDDAYATTEFDPERMTLPRLLARNHVLGSSLMRKQALDETDLSGGFVRYQDWDRWLSMLEAGWQIGLVPEVLFDYRQNPNSLSHTAAVADEFAIREKILKKHSKSYAKYYESIILDMERAFLELQEGKNWLENQYNNHLAEIDRLNARITELEQNPTLRHLVKFKAKKLLRHTNLKKEN